MLFAAAIDADEYIVIYDETIPDLPTFMKRYESYGGLAVGWILFGSSGLEERPTGGVLQSYTTCYVESPKYHFKTILNVQYTWLNVNAHYFLYTYGKFAGN